MINVLETIGVIQICDRRIRMLIFYVFIYLFINNFLNHSKSVPKYTYYRFLRIFSLATEKDFFLKYNKKGPQILFFRRKIEFKNVNAIYVSEIKRPCLRNSGLGNSLVK